MKDEIESTRAGDGNAQVPWSKTVEAVSLLLNHATQWPIDDCENFAATIIGMVTAAPAVSAPAEERAAFEAWLETLMDPDPRANCCIETATELRGDGHYVMSATRIAWDAWQARASFQAPVTGDAA